MVLSVDRLTPHEDRLGTDVFLAATTQLFLKFWTEKVRDRSEVL